MFPQSVCGLTQPLVLQLLRLETLYGTSIRKAELEARLQYLKVRNPVDDQPPLSSPLPKPLPFRPHSFMGSFSHLNLP